MLSTQCEMYVVNFFKKVDFFCNDLTCTKYKHEACYSTEPQTDLFHTSEKKDKQLPGPPKS